MRTIQIEGKSFDLRLYKSEGRSYLFVTERNGYRNRWIRFSAEAVAWYAVWMSKIVTMERGFRNLRKGCTRFWWSIRRTRVGKFLELGTGWFRKNFSVFIPCGARGQGWRSFANAFCDMAKGFSNVTAEVCRGGESGGREQQRMRSWKQIVVEGKDKSGLGESRQAVTADGGRVVADKVVRCCRCGGVVLSNEDQPESSKTRKQAPMVARVSEQAWKITEEAGMGRGDREPNLSGPGSIVIYLDLGQVSGKDSASFISKLGQLIDQVHGHDRDLGLPEVKASSPEMGISQLGLQNKESHGLKMMGQTQEAGVIKSTVVQPSEQQREGAVARDSKEHESPIRNTTDSEPKNAGLKVQKVYHRRKLIQKGMEMKKFFEEKSKNSGEIIPKSLKRNSENEIVIVEDSNLKDKFGSSSEANSKDKIGNSSEGIIKRKEVINWGDVSDSESEGISEFDCDGGLLLDEIKDLYGYVSDSIDNLGDVSYVHPTPLEGLEGVPIFGDDDLNKDPQRNDGILTAPKEEISKEDREVQNLMHNLDLKLCDPGGNEVYFGGGKIKSKKGHRELDNLKCSVNYEGKGLKRGFLG